MNLNPKLTMAGIWVPVDGSTLNKNNTGGLLQNLSALLPIGKNGEYGIILSGNGASGGFSSDPSNFVQVKIAVLLPDHLGGYQIGTEQLISDPYINGTQSILVTDFNGDGTPDIFMSAENEMPFILKPSIAYMSDGSGKYKKVTLADSVINHSAMLVFIDGKPTVVATAYPLDNTIAGRGTTNAIYTFENGAFKIQSTQYINGVASGTLGRFGANGELEMIRGDVVSGWNGISWTAMNIVVYPFDGKDVNVSKPIQTIVPYLSTLPEYKDFPANIGGKGLTHTFQLWAIELNNDGHLDVLAGETMWSSANTNFPSALQVLINNGDGTFKDETARLNSSMSLNVEQIDYNPTFLDIDNSGIQTLFFGSQNFYATQRQSNYLILNDGSGQLHVGLHDEFQDLAKQANSFVNSQYQQQGFSTNPDVFFPKFIAVPQPNGDVNYVAVVNAGHWYDTAKTLWQDQNFLVNIPIAFNPTTEFKKNIVISDRNHSTLMRTWAGDDLFYANNSSTSSAHIDGGLGIDKSIYNSPIKNFSIKGTSTNSFEVKTSTTSTSTKISDTLVNVERLVFTDTSVALDVAGNAGIAVKLISAVFGKDAISNKNFVGIGLDLLDKGMSYDNLGTLAIGAAGAKTSDDIVSLLWRNVVGSVATEADKAPFIQLLDAGMSSGVLVHLAADTIFNTNQINLVGLAVTGIEYTPL